MEVREGQPTVVDVREREARVVEERVWEGERRIVSEKEMAKTKRESVHMAVTTDRPQIETLQRQKVVEIIKEKPVPYETVVDVRYDVVVDVPVERTIEKERIIETLVEKPIEKTIEIPVEQIIEIPVEKIIEKPIQIQKYVERPYERIVQAPYEVLRENLIYKDRVIDVDEREVSRYPQASVLPTTVEYLRKEKFVEKPVYWENIIQKDVFIERPRTVEVPIERLVEKRVQTYYERPVPVERVYHQEIEVPIENTIIQPIEFIIEKPVYRENIIEKSYPVERIKEVEIVVPVEQIVERPVYFENKIERPIDMIVEVPVPVEKIVEKPVEKVNVREIEIEGVRGVEVGKTVKKTVPTVRRVEKTADLPVFKTVFNDQYKNIDIKVNRFLEKPAEAVVNIPVKVETLTEIGRYKDVVTELKTDILTENLKAVEKYVELQKPVDVVLEKKVEVIKEKIVEVPVEKLVEVNLKVMAERPKFKENVFETEYPIEVEVQEIGHEMIQNEETVEVEDEKMAEEITRRNAELHQEESKNRNLRIQFEEINSEYNELKNQSRMIHEQENAKLRGHLNKLETELRSLSQTKERLLRQSHSRPRIVETILNKDPKVESLKSRLRGLISENGILVKQISDKGDQVRKLKLINPRPAL